MFRLWRDFVCCLVVAALLPLVARTQENDDSLSIRALKRRSLEELMDIEVTLASKTPQRLSATASAIQVVTGNDIRRSSASTLAEALRLAPNLTVAQTSAHDWAITARGFNGAPLANNSLANKLLVMIDGRSVYTPLFGGVFWDVQQILLDDVDQIEVVSGPGGSLWGSNAVNGVINILTKSAQETQGLLVSGGLGSLMRDYGAVRYGTRFSENIFARVYVQRWDHRPTLLPTGADATDTWRLTQGGFRLDYHPSKTTTFTLQGDVHAGSEDGTATNTYVDGENLLARWTHITQDNNELRAQVYFDRTWRNLPTSVPNNGFSEELTTFDFDFQHRLHFGARHILLWGAGVRLMQEDIDTTTTISFSPQNRDMKLLNGFVQYEFALLPDLLKFTIGTKLEHNDFSGYELQPGLRIAWTPENRHTIWGAVSRAVHSPSRFDADVVVPLIGDSSFTSEKLVAYELGYRIRPVDELTLSLAAYFNTYRSLRSINFLAPPPRYVFTNGQRAESWGVELSGLFQAMSWWRLRFGYTHFKKNIWPTSVGIVPTGDLIEGIDPENTFLLHSMIDLPAHLQFDLVARYVGDLPSTTLSSSVPGYATFDARVAFQTNHWMLSLVGRNLAHDRHPEFRSLLRRSLFGKISFTL
ncbi:MAG: TonB-dependent receptor [Ignavibacteriae bacterium]|nr:TonB-dependent receptor [Ignavibacteriota bacterium]